MKVKVKNSFRIVTLLAGIAISTAAFSQPGPRGEGFDKRQGPPPFQDSARIESMIERFSEKAELTENQEAKLKEMFKEHMEQVKEMTRPRASREEMKTFREEFHSNVMTELTEEQQEVFEEFMKKQQHRREHRRHPGHRNR